MDKDGSSEGLIDTTTEDKSGGLDDEQEDNLSEFSDVDDEILNREEVKQFILDYFIYFYSLEKSFKRC